MAAPICYKQCKILLFIDPQIIVHFSWFLVIFITVHLSCVMMQLGPKAEDVSEPVKPFSFLMRFILGALAGMYYVLVPIYMWLKDQIVPKGQPI